MASPFDSNKTLIFKSLTDDGPNRYLDSDPAASQEESVYVIDSTNFNTRPGTHWDAHKLPDGTYSLKSNASRYLDSWPTAPKIEITVFLNDTIDGKAGTHWEPQLLSDGTYALKSKPATKGQKCFLDSWPKAPSLEQRVYLSDTTDISKRKGTHWMVGVDWYTNQEVEDIVQEQYPGVKIAFYKADAKYGQMEFQTLKNIWDKSGLGAYMWQREKFDCDAFAVCFKAEVAKWCYEERAPFDAACLCGIMWGRNNTRSAHAFNFSVDAFGDLILFEPPNGTKIALYKWVPFFCMV